MVKRTQGVMLVMALGLLGGCAGLADEGMPANMPIAGHKFAVIHAGMTYGQFAAAFGEGWMSHASEGDAKYWFFDDGRTVVVPAEVWKGANQPLRYRVIGLAPAAPAVTIPILPASSEIKLTTQR